MLGFVWEPSKLWVIIFLKLIIYWINSLNNRRKYHLQTSLALKVVRFSVESCQSEVCEVKRDMIAIKHEIDSVQLVKDEIDDIRESLDRLEAEAQRRKNKLLEQVSIANPAAEGKRSQEREKYLIVFSGIILHFRLINFFFELWHGRSNRRRLFVFFIVEVLLISFVILPSFPQTLPNESQNNIQNYVLNGLLIILD